MNEQREEKKNRENCEDLDVLLIELEEDWDVRTRELYVSWATKSHSKSSV